MTVTTILFETITAAVQAYDTLQPMIEVGLDCNALTYSELDEELVKWLVSDRDSRAEGIAIVNRETRKESIFTPSVLLVNLHTLYAKRYPLGLSINTRTYR